MIRVLIAAAILMAAACASDQGPNAAVVQAMPSEQPTATALPTTEVLAPTAVSVVPTPTAVPVPESTEVPAPSVTPAATATALPVVEAQPVLQDPQPIQAAPRADAESAAVMIATTGHIVTFGFADKLSADEIASVVAYVKATFP